MHDGFEAVIPYADPYLPAIARPKPDEIREAEAVETEEWVGNQVDPVAVIDT
jgi:hypothetical protein